MVIQTPARPDGRAISSSNQDRQILEAFSRGEIGRLAAMAALRLDYGALLERLAAEGLPRYRVSEDAARIMADGFVTLVAEARR